MEAIDFLGNLIKVALGYRAHTEHFIKLDKHLQQAWRVKYQAEVALCK